jgi:uroporphyrinogen-III decarboxylase
MTDHRTNILAVLRGEPLGGLLFVPRLDIWYNCNKARGTMPRGYEGLSLRDVAAKLGVGFHSVVPDFIRSAPVEDVHHRGLGFYNNPEFPFRADFSAVDYEVDRSENELKVVYHASGGDITTRFNYGPELLNSGASIPDILEHPIKTREDYGRLAEVLQKVRIRPMPEQYQAYHDCTGTAGVAVAYLSLACGPMHHIMRDLRRYEDFCLDLYDDPSLLAPCVDALAPLHDAILECAAVSSAEAVLYGANYDDTLTYRPFFEAHITPWLNKATDTMRAVGKLLLTHTDGENKDLLPALEHCRFDIADSVCPAPMTKLTIQEYRDFFGNRTSIWGGIPSAIVIPNICPENEFRQFVDSLISQSHPYNHLILSIADTTPPDADFARIQYIAEACAKTWRRC